MHPLQASWICNQLTLELFFLNMLGDLLSQGVLP